MEFLKFKDVSDFLRGCKEEKSEYTILMLETLDISKENLILHPERDEMTVRGRSRPANRRQADRCDR